MSISVIAVFFLGIAVGSFLNSYIWRSRPHPATLPKGEGTSLQQPPLPAGEGWGEGKSVWRDAKRPMVPRSAWRGRSYCAKCKKPLRWYELIPIASFILQFGRCRGCKKPVDWQYPLVELATGILFVLAFQQVWNLQSPVPSFALVLGEFGTWNLFGNWKLVIGNLTAWYLLAVLVTLFVYDLRYGLVPDQVVLPAIAVAAVYTVILNAVKDPVAISTGFLVSLGMTAVGMAVGTVFFAAQYYFSRGRWLGSGDIRIGALMGAIVGWPLITLGLALSYIVGGAVAALLLAAGKKRLGQTLPLGTFLTFGTTITFLYGEQIWNWYWR